VHRAVVPGMGNEQAGASTGVCPDVCELSVPSETPSFFKENGT
jgi:hypothetical protein